MDSRLKWLLFLAFWIVVGALELLLSGTLWTIIGGIVTVWLAYWQDKALKETNKEVRTVGFAAENRTTAEVVKDAGLYGGGERESNPKP